MSLLTLDVATQGLLSSLVPTLLEIATQGLIQSGESPETPTSTVSPYAWLAGLSDLYTRLGELVPDPVVLDPMKVIIHAVGAGIF